MKNDISFFIVLCLAFWAGPAKSDELGKKPAKPNIILNLIDEMGWSDLSCFGNEAITGLSKHFGSGATPARSEAEPEEDADPSDTKRIVEVRLETDSDEKGFEAARAMDGDKRTLWHSRWSKKRTPLPHRLSVLMPEPFEIKGFKISPRADMINAMIGRYEVYVSDDPRDLGLPVAKGEFPASHRDTTVTFEKPVRGRCFTILAISDHGGKTNSSIAELELISEQAVFRIPETPRKKIEKSFPDADPRRTDEYFRLLDDIVDRERFDRLAPETFLPDSLILPGDRDPVDVVCRRTAALLCDLTESWEGYDSGDDAAKLAELTESAKNIGPDQIPARFELFLRLCDLRRKIMFSNPLLRFDKILFVKKHRGTWNHMCDQYYGVNLPPGGGLFVLENPFEKNGEPATVRNLLEHSPVRSGRLQGRMLRDGSFLSPDLSFDGDKIAFAYVECTGDEQQRFHTDPSQGHWHPGRCFHIFTVNIDGSDLRQITDGTWNDFDPCWLPNDRMAFISERRGGYLRCGRECPTFTLFDMNPDGSMMRCLSYHETNEWHPSVTHDGRILYTRWDYPDRHGSIAHHPWITSLDGRDARHVHGNFSKRRLRADMELDCRAVPGSQKYVATAAPHHGQSYGSLILVDPQVEDDDAMSPVKRLTPEIGFPESQAGAQVYGTPWPLSEKYYLAVADFSMTPNQGMQGHPYVRGDYGIYLLDAFGNKELLYHDPEIGCNSPIPVMSRPTPPAPPRQVSEKIEHQPFVLPTHQRPAPAEPGTVLVVNAYESTRPLPSGTKLKELRVIQWLPMTVPSGNPPHEIGFREPTIPNSVVIARQVLGTVPIEEDGSVYFEIPSRAEVQFQVLDENGLAVQSMRSGTYLHDGENLSCNGCHEPKTTTPSVYSMTTLKALRRPPSKLKPEHPDSNPFSYPRLVQPVLDKHCVQCHVDEREKDTPGVPNLAREPVEDGWYASYRELVPKYGYFIYGEPLRTMPGKFGARNSKLYELLANGHHKVRLSPEELRRITLWLDCVSVFYGVYEKEGGEAQLQGEIVYPTLE